MGFSLSLVRVTISDDLCLRCEVCAGEASAATTAADQDYSASLKKRNKKIDQWASPRMEGTIASGESRSRSRSRDTEWVDPRIWGLCD